MPRSRSRIPLGVLLNGRKVGTLRRASTGAIDFQYAKDWLDWKETFPVSLSLPLSEDRYIGERVVNVFDNLLPDSDQIRRRVAERVGAEGSDAYSLLAALGQDCVGALQFLPDGLDPEPVGSPEGEPLDSAAIGDILNNLTMAPLGVGTDRDFRISLAGAQEKTALLKLDGQWLKPIGMTATTHILKPQIGRLPNGIDLSNSVENEFLCLKLLAAFGVPSAAVEIAEFGGRKTLVIERFDRFWTADGRLLRRPQEDCCQALSKPASQKYQSEGGPGIKDILGLLKGSDRPDQDVAIFLRAMIVFWLLGATDGHAKNFSIFLSPGGGIRLTPFYDVLSAQPSLDARQIRQNQFRLAMSVGRNRHYAVQDIVPRHFQETADQAAVGRRVLHAIIDDLATNAVRLADEVFHALPSGFPDAIISSLRDAIARRAQQFE